MKLRTHKQFIKELQSKNENFRNGDFEIVGVYKNNKTRIELSNKYGVLYCQPATLLDGRIPGISAAKDKDEYFQSILLEKNDSYKRGEITMIGEYVNDRTHILFKNKYGIIRLRPSALIRNHTPSIVAAVNKNEYFINQAKEVHGEFYNYSKVKYTNSTTKVTIIDPEFGEFDTQPKIHLVGGGCLERLKASQGWSHSAWGNRAKTSSLFKSYKVYIIRCWNETEEFFKIGKTFTSMNKRFKGKLPYNHEVIDIITNECGIFISKLESELHRKNKNNSYSPQISFDGATECYSVLTR